MGILQREAQEEPKTAPRTIRGEAISQSTQARREARKDRRATPRTKGSQ